MIIFAIGINDSRYILTKDHPEVPMDSFKVNLSILLQSAKQFSSTILALGLTRIEENKTTPCAWKPKKFYEEERVKSYDAIIQEVSKEHGALYIPFYDQLEGSDLEDGLHPNAAGHEKIFLAVKDFLNSKNLLAKSSPRSRGF